jgi:hypothetical protein
MTHIIIDDIDPLISYTVGGAARSTFPVPFAFFANGDLVVTVGNDELTLDTDYSVTGTTVDDGFSSGEVELDTAVTDTTVVIERILPIERVTDFPEAGPFSVRALNTQLDKFIAICQQIVAQIGTLGQRVTDAIALFTTLINADTTVTLFTTTAAIALANVDAGVLYIRTAGYDDVGDGGDALWKQVAFEPAHGAKVQTLNGVWFEYAEDEIRLAALGVKADGLSASAIGNLAAILVAIDAAPTDGCTIIAPPGEIYISGAIVVDKSLTFSGAGARATVFITTSTTADVFTVSAGYSTIEKFGIQSSVTRAAGSWYVDVTGGAWITIRDFDFLDADSGIRHGGTTWTVVRDGIMEIAPATGIGIQSTAGQGIIADNVIIAGAGLSVNNQPYAGFDLSFTGDSVISNSSCLVTGYGILAAPGVGQTCTSVLISNTFFDTCRVGCGLEPTAGKSVAQWKFSQCWFSTANFYGVSMAGSGGGLVSDVSFKDCILGSNGDVSGSGKGFYLNASGGVTIQNTLIDGCMVFNSNTSDIETLGTVVELRIVNSKIGHTGFPSAYGVALGAGAENVRIENNVFGTASTTKYQNLSSGTDIRLHNNIGLTTENYGTATVSPNGSGQVTITHSCDLQPLWAHGMAYGAGFVNIQWTSISATQATFTFYDAAGAAITVGSYSFIWRTGRI